MSFRQWVNRNPAVIALLVVVVVGLSVWVVWSQTGGAATAEPAKAGYFSTDDGKTWFVDDVEKVPPFEKDGQQAVRAHLFKCGSGEPVVGYLERFTEKGKEVTERYRAEQQASPGMPPKSLGEIASLGVNATEVKKPGESKWIPKGQALQLVQYKCEDGNAGVAVTP